MAKKPQVKCPKCGKYFFREDHEFVNTGRRYYHRECFDSLDEEDKLTQEIHRKMRETLKEGYINKKVTRQINQYVSQGKTLQGILDTLNYWYDVKKEDPAKAAGGIGIVEYVYVEAQKYWKKKNQQQSINKDLDLSSYDKKVTFKVTPTPISKPKRVKLFNLD